MSDTFDHEGDAWGILLDSDNYWEDRGYSGRGGDYTPPDPDYFHSWRTIDKIVRFTEKAYQVQKEGVIFWVAKKLIRSKVDSTSARLFVHRRYFDGNFDAAKRNKEKENRKIKTAINNLPDYSPLDESAVPF